MTTLLAKPNTAAVPRSKNSKKGLSSVLGGGFVRNLMREAKISFCSEMEGLALQVTRPNSAAVPLNLFEELTNFVDLEYDNPELIVGILVKLSRKFSESNVFTQVKALLTLHLVMQKIEDKSKLAWAKAIHSMRDEVDEKVKMNFFSLEAIEDSSSSTSTVLELQTLEFNRLYANYLFDYLAIRGEKSSSKNAMTPSDKASLILRLVKDGDELEALCNQMDTALSRQALDALLTDRFWYAKTLIKFYEGNAFDGDYGLEKDVEKVLMKLDSKFKPVVRPMIELTEPEEDDKDEDEDKDEEKQTSTTKNEESEEEEMKLPKSNDDDTSGSDIPPVLRKAVKNSINKPSTIENKKKTVKSGTAKKATSKTGSASTTSKASTASTKSTKKSGKGK